MKRENFNSRIGFILVSAGCAIGIGNVWKFPYLAGQNGGGYFVLFYLLFLIIMGIPVMTMELAVGRASRKSAVLGYKALEPAGSKWHWHGWACVIGCLLLMMYYTTVSGWMLAYFFKFVSGAFTTVTVETSDSVFANMLGNPVEMGIFMAVMEFFTSSLSVAVVTVGGLLIMKGQMDTVDLLTFTLYIASFVNPIRKLANFTELFSNGTAGFERFLEIMRTAPELHDAPDALELTHVRGEIGVENVSFSYEDDPEVLHDVSLHVPAGKTVAIVGPSGGGKSTLCQLIPRFYDVTGGSITVDGHDVRSVTQESLRRSIGIVQQDVFLFADSILENIRYGKPGATMEEIVEAAKRAEIYDDIMAMPDGFDTYVGERGTLLSGGQKQRISIARIFLKNPPILILDEATSALDTLTEAKIQHAFDELAKNRTTLIIAHRLSTIRAAGEIVVIADGRIAERGTNEELLKKDGIYASLCRTQNLLA